MKRPAVFDRRRFLEAAARTTAGLAVGMRGAPALLAKRSPNDVLRVGCIGVGTQGHRLLRQAQAVPNTEIRVICDLYQGNIERARRLTKNPNVRIEPEWEKVVQDPGDRCGDHRRAGLLARADGGRRRAGEEGHLRREGTVQDAGRGQGHAQGGEGEQGRLAAGASLQQPADVSQSRQILSSGALGKVPLVRTYIDRTSEFPEWKFYTDYDIHQAPSDAGPQTIDWTRFLANAPTRPFDIERFFTWRCYWDYGTGIAGDLMSHLWDSVNMVMGMGIPGSAVTHGGLYYWTNDREVPDQWTVLFDYPKQNLAVQFNCAFHNVHVGEMAQYLGRDQTLEVSPDSCRTYAPEWKPEHREKSARARQSALQVGLNPADGVVPPDYSYKPGELQVTGHMQDFLDCVRSRAVPRCGIDRAFEEAVAIIMSVEAFRQERKVRWDPVREVIV